MEKSVVDLKEKILRMVVEQENTTVDEARTALRDALTEYDLMRDKAIKKKQVQFLAEEFAARHPTQK